jgi:propanol-preferring alcohol dehydrogenase
VGVRAVRLVAHRTPLVDDTIPEPALTAGAVRVAIKAAGICHSDAHYRAGNAGSDVLPRTLGHEIAGEVVECGPGVTTHKAGDRVCLHYVLSCTRCAFCLRGEEQFCTSYAMLGNTVDGGFAEQVTVPARNAVHLPASIPYAQGAIMMCSSATVLHALRKGRLAPGERVAVIGIGGLGVSAIQLAARLGASQVVGVDLNPERLTSATKYGAVAVRGGPDAAAAVRDATAGEGVNVVLDLVGGNATTNSALSMLAPRGRAVVVGLSHETVAVNAYRRILAQEAELIGSNDHLLSELGELIAFVQAGELRLAEVVANTVPLDAARINAVMDALDAGRAPLRTVVTL